MTDNREKNPFLDQWRSSFHRARNNSQQPAEKSHGVEMPCGGRHACGKCMVYAEGSFAVPSETEQKLLGAERLAQGIRLACFLEAVPDGKIDALQQEADGSETICVSTPSAPPVAACRPRSRQSAPVQRSRQSAPVQRSRQSAVQRSRQSTPALRCLQKLRPARGSTVISARRWISVQRQLQPSSIGKAGLSERWAHGIPVRVWSGCHQPDRSFSGGKSR